MRETETYETVTVGQTLHVVGRPATVTAVPQTWSPRQTGTFDLETADGVRFELSAHRAAPAPTREGML